ncbi:MAG: M57 family metalloprotease [Bacteroidota bacterium]
MKSNVKQSLFYFVPLSLLLICCGCQKEPPAPPKASFTETDPSTIQVDANSPGRGYEAEIIRHVEGHGVHLDFAERINFHFPDGHTEERILVDGCIALTETELRDLVALDESGDRQYRTFNLVSPQTINVVGYNGGTYALTSKMRTALQWAVNNYNALNINLNFNLTFTTNLSNADITVYRNPFNNNAGGVAGFPSGGRPHPLVQIYNGMESYNTNTVEHVMTHEIGHCLGLRHTDYFNRASCGQNANEGSGSDGAVHIPGTPTGIDWNSVMLACFSNNEDGEFGFYDRVALEFLY